MNFSPACPIFSTYYMSLSSVDYTLGTEEQSLSFHDNQALSFDMGLPESAFDHLMELWYH